MATSKRAVASSEEPKKTGVYNSKSIETLRFPESIRRNPAMYIGATDAYGVFVAKRELLDNAADEFMAGRNKKVEAIMHQDGSFWVLDEGSGIPQGIQKFELNLNGRKAVSRIPTMQAVFGELHTSGKYRSEAYEVSIGSHGVGSKGTNATSTFFEVWTFRNGAWFNIRFEKGKLVAPVTALNRAPKHPLTGKPLTKGTMIHFKPDPSIFSVKSFPPQMLVDWAEVMSYLNPGFAITLHIRGKSKTFLSKLGAKEYIQAILAKAKAEAETLYFESKTDLADVVIGFSNIDGRDVRGFTNGLRNAQGGRHVDSVTRALYQAVQKYKGKKQDFSSFDFEDGLVGIVNAKLHKAEFSSQDKARLTDPRMAKPYEELVAKDAAAFFAKNKALAGRLCEKAARINELKNKFKQSKAVVSELNKMKRQGMPAKYAPAQRSVPFKDRELLIVEGESAAGNLRKVRKPCQALLPLTGKILNVAKASGDRPLISAAIVSILAAIGFDPKAKDPMAKLEVGKIICLADPDPDGRHINSLLLTLFAKYLPDLFDRGIVHVADMPEFYSLYRNQIFLGNTLSDVQKQLTKHGIKTDVKHAKGWGEVDPAVMKVLAVDDSRRLLRLNKLLKSDKEELNKYMGKDVTSRRSKVDATAESE